MSTRAQRVARAPDRDGFAAELGHTAERWPAQHTATGAFGVGDEERLTEVRREHHLVLGEPSLQEQHAACRPRPEQAGSADEEPERLLRGACAGCEQLLIELEEGHHAHRTTRWHAMQDRFGSDQHVGVGHGFRRRIDRGDTRPREQRREVVADRPHSRSDGTETRAVAVETDRRSHGVAARARELVVVFSHGRATPLTTRQLATRAAREQPCPTLAVQHADRSPTGIAHSAELVGEHAREQRLTGLFVARVDHRHTRPRNAGVRVGSRIEGDEHIDRRSRRDHADRGAGTSARSMATSRAFQVGARSSSSASSASSTTTMRERSGTGAQTAVRPPTTTHAPARARSHAALSSASVRSERTLSTSRPSILEDGDEPSRALGVRVEDDARTLGRNQPRRKCAVVAVGGDDHQRDVGCVERRVHRGLELGLVADCDHIGRRRGAEERGEGPGPSPRAEATQVDDVGGWPGRHDRDDLAQARTFDLGRRHGRLEHPPAHATTVERHPHDRADAHVRRQPVRERVVERAMDCGNVRLDATNPRVRRSSITALAYASAFAALPSSSDASVRSQVKSRSDRPKCP